jgi:hypothetical protein
MYDGGYEGMIVLEMRGGAIIYERDERDESYGHMCRLHNDILRIWGVEEDDKNAGLILV